MSLAPYTQRLEQDCDPVATASDADTVIGIAPFAGTVTSVTYIPATVLTGADTNSRTLSVVNKGQSGAGTTVIASKAFTNGVNAPANDETPITLSATAADLVVASGDVLQFHSLHIGTGLADPGGTVEVLLNRT